MHCYSVARTIEEWGGVARVWTSKWADCHTLLPISAVVVAFGHA